MPEPEFEFLPGHTLVTQIDQIEPLEPHPLDEPLPPLTMVRVIGGAFKGFVGHVYDHPITADYIACVAIREGNPEQWTGY